MIEIKPLSAINAAVSVPGSKSYTHRMLIAAALSDGECIIRNRLKSEDTNLTAGALTRFGIRISTENNLTLIHGRSGELTPPQSEIFLANSGTSMRLLTGVAALCKGKCLLTGSKRMHARPIQDLLDGLNQIGTKACSVDGNGCPPVEIEGSATVGGRVSLNCAISSQYLSALLMIAPYTQNGIEVTVSKGPVSRPYVDVTLDVLQKFGVRFDRGDYNWFNVPGNQIYRAGNYIVEPDCSQASYFWAAAAITGSSVTVKDVSEDSSQGDIRFVDLLERMGCRITRQSRGIKVTGSSLSAIETDMADIPDVVPTMAVVAAFAGGTSVLKNVLHLKAKESDRLAALENELAKMGIEVSCRDSDLIIKGGEPTGARIETYGDHRIAMSFAVAGLKTTGTIIKNETCVEKSFPDFWQVFETLYPQNHRPPAELGV
jgi:3-phosphoshikimate 1-carboxyvinyltransferase